MAKITLLTPSSPVPSGERNLTARSVSLTESTPGEIGRGPSAALLASGLQLGESSTRFSSLLSESRRLHEFNTAMTTAATAVDEAETRLREDPDYQSVPARFEKEVEEIHNNILKTFTHPQARDQFEGAFGTYRQSRQQAVFHHIVRREQEVQTKHLVEGLFSDLNLIGKAVDPDQIQILQAQGLKSIEDRFSVGGIPGEKAAELKRWFITRGAALKGRQDVLQDPKGAMARLQSDVWQELYPGLDDDRRIDLIYKARGEVAKLEAEDNAERVQLTKETGNLMRDNIASILKTGREVPVDLDMVRTLHGRVAAADFEEDVHHAHMAYHSIVQLRTASPEQRKAILASIEPAPGIPGFAGRLKFFEMVQREDREIQDALTRDPVGYLTSVTGAKTIDRVIALQEHMGVAIPKATSKAWRDAWKARFEASGPEQKMELIQASRKDKGGHFNQVMRELELGYDYTYAAYLPVHKGKRVIQVLGMKDSEFGLDPMAKAAVGKSAEDTFFTGDTVGNVLNQMARMTGNLQYNEMAQQLGSITKKMAWHMGDAEKALKYLWKDDYNYVIDDHLGYAFFPKAYDAGAMKDKMKRGRADAVRFLPEKVRDAEYGRDVGTRAVWIPSPEMDETFTLVDPVVGKAVIRRDGKPIRMHYSGYITK